jgi:hypothetical protein
MATRTISPAGGNWSAAAAWVEGVVPTNADDVVANATSGPLVITAGAVCRSFDLTGMTASVSGSGVTLTIGGSTAGPGNLIFQMGSGFSHPFTGTYSLNTTAGTPQTVGIGRSLDCALTVNSPGGAVRLLTSLSLNSQVLKLTAGTFDSNGQTLTMNQISSTGSLARSLILNGSAVFLDLAGGFGLDVSGSNYSVSAGSASLTMGPNTGFQGGGGTYGTVGWTTISSQAVGITGNNTFTNLSFALSAAFFAEIHFFGGTTQTVTGALTITNSGTAHTYVATGLNNFGGTWNAGTPATIALGATGTATLSNVSFMDIIVTGTNTPVSGTRIGNGLGNSGITFSVPRTLYWVGNSGNWSDSSRLHWSLTSGGSTGASVLPPLAQDDVIIDSNSFTAPNQTINNDVQWQCRNLTASTAQTGCKLTAAVTGSYFGNVAVAGSGGFGLNQVIAMRTRSTATLTPNPPAVVGSITVQAPGGTVTLTGNFTGGPMILTAGVFDAATYNVTIPSFTSNTPGGVSNTQPRELRMGTGQWTWLNAASPGWLMSTAANLFTLTKGSSNLLISGTPASTADLTGNNQPMPPITCSVVSAKSVQFLPSVVAVSVDLVSGGLSLQAGDLTCDAFRSVGNQTRNFQAGTNSVHVNGPITFGGTNFTLTPGTGAFNCAPTALETIVTTNGLTFATLRLAPPVGGEIAVYGALLAGTLQAVGPAGGTGIVNLNEAAVLTTQLTATGNSATNRIKVYGPLWGGTATVTTPGTSLTNVDLININQAGTATWTGTSKTNSFTGYINQAIEA